MTTIVIKPKNKAEQQLLTKLLKKMNVEAQLIEEPFPNRETIQAMKDVELRKGTKFKDTNELFTQLGI